VLRGQFLFFDYDPRPTKGGNVQTRFVGPWSRRARPPGVAIRGLHTMQGSA
jgi:hypothetical protein